MLYSIDYGLTETKKEVFEMGERGPAPGPYGSVSKSKATALRLPERIDHAVREHAKITGKSITLIITEALAKYLKVPKKTVIKDK